jgi:hypothetical protein
MQSYHETSAAISAVANWREIAATLAIFAALAALIAWQVKGTPEKCRNWLASSAMSLEALAMAMAVFWAIQQGAGILSVFFAAGFVGLALSKAVTISALVQAHREHKHGAFFVALVALLGAYFTVYGAGVFEGTLHSAGKHEQAAAESAPVTAIDAQLQAARGRLESLAGYADAGKADAEISQAKADAAQAQGRISELQARISDALQAVPLNSQGKPAGRSLGALSQNCAESYSGHYSGACGAVRDMRREMSALAGSGGGTGDYARGHSEYSGMRAHIAELETRRAELLAGGASTGTAAGADDRLVSWVFGLENIQNAAGLKWLLLVAIFDFLSLALRLAGELLLGRDIAGEYARKLAALINAGLDPARAGAMLGGNARAREEPPQQEQPRVFGFAPATAPATARDSLPPETQARAPGAFRSWQEQAQARIGADNIGMANNIATANIGADRIIYRDLERVPPELSQRQGAGRVGKIDACINCGSDFQIAAHNGLRCKSCAAVAVSSYRQKLKQAKTA